MKNKKYDEVLNKMLFLQDDINGKFIGIVISHNVKTELEFNQEKEIIFSQAQMIVKCFNSNDKEIIENGINMFFCTSPITGLSLNKIYNFIYKFKKSKTDEEIKNFLESCDG